VVRKWGYTYCRGRTRAAIGVFDVCACALRELFKQESALYSHLLDLTFYTRETKTSGIVRLFNLVCAVLKLDAFSSIGFLDGRR
jgi:hypothetical protein